MKLSMFFSAFLFLTTAAQASELACWNVWAKKGAGPSFTATIEDNNNLSDVQILDNQSLYGDFSIDKVTPEATGVEITTKRSPYRGHQNFDLTPNGSLRLILPLDLSPDALKAAVIKGGNLPENLAKRQNGVLIISGGLVDSMGDFYNRMHCVSK